MLSIFVIAPLGALAIDRPLFGNWIWHIDPDKARDWGDRRGARLTMPGNALAAPDVGLGAQIDT
jgi:hypothetical protein